jgi:anti-sigma B factor antagonist
MTRLTIDEGPRGGDWVIAPAGELDIATADNLSDRISQATARWTRWRIVVDLAELSFMDSCGLRVLLSAARAARNDGGRLQLLPGPLAVQRLFAVTGTELLLPFAGE